MTQPVINIKYNFVNKVKYIDNGGGYLYNFILILNGEKHYAIFKQYFFNKE